MDDFGTCFGSFYYLKHLPVDYLKLDGEFIQNLPNTDEVVVDSYLDDGMCAEFVDNVSLIGYARLERYIVENLCGARYATGFGQLLTDIPTKIAVWLALAEVLKADHPALSYLYGNTIDASDSLLTGNYGIASSEYMILRRDGAPLPHGGRAPSQSDH